MCVFVRYGQCTDWGFLFSIVHEVCLVAIFVIRSNCWVGSITYLTCLCKVGG